MSLFLKCHADYMVYTPILLDVDLTPLLRSSGPELLPLPLQARRWYHDSMDMGPIDLHACYAVLLPNLSEDYAIYSHPLVGFPQHFDIAVDPGA